MMTRHEREMYLKVEQWRTYVVHTPMDISCLPRAYFSAPIFDSKSSSTFVLMQGGVATEKFSGGHLNIGGAQRGYFRNFGRFYGFFIAISEIIGGGPPQ